MQTAVSVKVVLGGVSGFGKGEKVNIFMSHALDTGHLTRTPGVYGRLSFNMSVSTLWLHLCL